MTLVVGRLVGSRVAIVSDTMLIEHDKPLPFQNGVIKSCMLPGDLCVSFSNSPVTAARAFSEFVAKYPAGTALDDVVLFFERSSETTGNDYLIATDNPARLVKIADGQRVSSQSNTLWIGDHAAYVRFRESEAKARPRAEGGRAVNAVLFADELAGSPASDLFSTMRNITADPELPTVGGFVPVISNRDNGFRYSVYSDMLFDWPSDKPKDHDLKLTDRIAFTATGENTSYSISQISPGFMNCNLAAFYFVSAKKLFLFYGENNSLPNRCKIFPEVAASEIYKTLNAFVQFDLKWLVLVTSPRSADKVQVDTSNVKTPGVQFAIYADANTFPKPS
jgi:hypothetical protein